MRPAVLQSNVRLADDVRDNITAVEDAGRFIQRIRDDCGDGDELLVAVESLRLRTAAYRRGWLRRIQKQIEKS